MVISIFFYLFALCLVFGCLGVILSKNPIHSVFYLIFSFFNAAALFVLLKAEFLAVILVMIYVGAIAVLFLFVVLLVNIKVAAKRIVYSKYLLIGLVLVSILSAELYVLFYNGSLILSKNKNMNSVLNINSVIDLGNVLFSHYYYVFLLSSLILTVAMVASVVLVIPVTKGDNKSQSVYQQNLRSSQKSVYSVKVENEQGTK